MIVSTDLIDKNWDKRLDMQYFSSYFKIIIDFQFQMFQFLFSIRAKKFSSILFYFSLIFYMIDVNEDPK